MDLLNNLEYWHWWVLALVLGILEVFAPGAIFIWFGVAAAVVGALLLVLPIPWPVQMFLFSLLSVAAVVGWKIYRKRNPEENLYPTLNRRGAQLIGRTFTLDEAIVNASGKIRVDDSTWKVRGADMDAGARVKVTGVDGTILEVAAVD